MENSWNNKLLPGMKELTASEAAVVIGGDGIWYWMFYGLGGINYLLR